MNWLDRLFDWCMPVKRITRYKGTGYDASGYQCTCVKEVK